MTVIIITIIIVAVVVVIVFFGVNIAVCFSFLEGDIWQDCPPASLHGCISCQLAAMSLMCHHMPQPALRRCDCTKSMKALQAYVHHDMCLLPNNNTTVMSSE